MAGVAAQMTMRGEITLVDQALGEPPFTGDHVVTLRFQACADECAPGRYGDVGHHAVDPDWIPMPHAGHFIVTFKCNLNVWAAALGR